MKGRNTFYVQTKHDRARRQDLQLSYHTLLYPFRRSALRRGLHDCDRSACCIDGESIAAQCLNRFIVLTHQ